LQEQFLEFALPVASAFGSLGWPALTVFLLVSLWIYLHTPGGTTTVRGFLRFAFPATHYVGASARVDYALYFIQGIFAIGFGAYLAYQGGPLQSGVTTLLASLFGPEPPLSSTPITAALLGFVLFFARDFGWFLAHWASHRVPWLWEFHKVHHSASALNPITTNRFHPVDTALLATSVFVFHSLANGVGQYLVRPDASASTLAGHTFMVLLILASLFSAFRHSHLWISFGPRVSRVISSPAMHQLHHSDDDRHAHKNFALYVSLFDWAFGTLYVPRGRESFSVGLNGEEADYRSVRAAIWTPVSKLRARRATLSSPRYAIGPPQAPRDDP
jgi:sterol desaturase/sphingolipid hydroxylase (fatty acid hydroxylase superfamily)